MAKAEKPAVKGKSRRLEAAVHYGKTILTEDYHEERYPCERPLDELVLLEHSVEPHIARITLNRPEKHNAFYPPYSFLELGRKLDIAAMDDDIKVIIIRGAGESFCAGEDLNITLYEHVGGVPGKKPPQSKRMEGMYQFIEGFVRKLAYCPKTTIAQVHGWAVEAGLATAMACDLIVAGESAKLSHAGQRIGFGGMEPMSGFLHYLTAGPKRSKEWLLTGRTISTKEALDWGVVNSVVPDDQLEEETLKLARAVAAHSTDNLMLGKMWWNLVMDMMGQSKGFEIWKIAQPLLSNVMWREDEYNYIGKRAKVGATESFKQRNAVWEDPNKGGK